MRVHALGLQLLTNLGIDGDDQPRPTVHQRRHPRGTEMVEERYPLHVVQKALGHVDPRSTQVYADLSDLQLRHELERHRRERWGVRRPVVPI